MSEPIIVAILAAIPPTLVAMASLIVASKGLAKSEVIHQQTNSRLTEMQDNVARLERLLGQRDEQIAQQTAHQTREGPVP
jgi:hypothetical protein